MFTSRAEFRILLRQDDADRRLTPRAYELGLASSQRYAFWKEKEAEIDRILSFCQNFSVKASLINPYLETLETTPLTKGCKLIDIISRPGLSFENLAPALTRLRETLNAIPNRKEEITEAAEILIKYQGYIDRERQLAEKMMRLENLHIRGRFNYEEIQSLSTEARQKLSHIDPDTLAQASRIPGVSPSDINVLMVLMGR